MTQISASLLKELQKELSTNQHDLEHFKYSDGGRTSSNHANERADCTVKVLSHAFGYAYDTSHDWLKSEGRRTNHGFDVEPLLLNKAFWPKYNITFYSFNKLDRKLLHFFVKECKGTWIVKTHKHLTVIKDSIVLDEFVTWNSTVIRAYHIERKS